MTKEEFISIIDKEKEAIKAEIANLNNKIEYYSQQSLAGPSFAQEGEENPLGELEQQRLYSLSKDKVLVMFLQHPLYLKISKETEQEKDQLINSVILKSETELKDKEKELEALKGKKVEAVIPPDFSSLSADEKLEYYKKDQERIAQEKAQNKKAADELANDTVALTGKIQALRSPQGKKEYLDERTKMMLGAAFGDNEQNYQEVMTFFSSLDTLPQGISQELAKQLYSNPEFTRNLLSKYRDLHFNNPQYEGSLLRGVSSSTMLLTGIFGSELSNVNNKLSNEEVYKKMEEILGIKHSQVMGFNEIESMYSNKNISSTIDDAKLKTVAEIREARKRARELQLSPEVYKLDVEKYFKTDEGVKEFGATVSEFRTVVSRVQSSGLDQATVSTITTGIFKHKTANGNVVDITLEQAHQKMAEFRVEYAEAIKKKFGEISSEKAEKRGKEVCTKAEVFYRELTQGFTELNNRTRASILVPMADGLSVTKSYNSVYGGYSSGSVSPTVIILNRDDSEFEAYVGNVENGFESIKNTLNNNISTAYTSGKEQIDKGIKSTEDEIFQMIKPVMGGAESKEQVIAVGQSTIKGLFGDVIERSMTQDQYNQNQKNNIPNPDIDADLELARRRNAYFEYMNREDELGQAVRSYMGDSEEPVSAEMDSTSVGHSK